MNSYKQSVRGGSWNSGYGGPLRAAASSDVGDARRRASVGFRCVRVVASMFVPIRGGSCNGGVRDARTADRYASDLGARAYYIGLRCMRRGVP